MKIIGTHSDDIRSLITGSASYEIPSALGQDLEAAPFAKMIVNSNGSYQNDYILTKSVDYYLKDGEIFLRPNELLDRENFSAGEYTLQFDFLQRFVQFKYYLAEISPSGLEIRLNSGQSDDIESNRGLVQAFLGLSEDGNTAYNFECYVELPQGRLLPINNYIIDETKENNTSVILKLNRPFPGNIPLYDKTIKIVKKVLESQLEQISFVDQDDLATGARRGLSIDFGFLPETSFVNDEDQTYSDLQSGSLNTIYEVTKNKKDKNLNIDFSEFSNHVFFGSAVTKLENFKDRAVKLEGLHSQLTASLVVSSSDDERQHREDLLSKITAEKEKFTAYERFMYNDNQQTSPNSAPGLGTNLAGNNFKNTQENNYVKISGSGADGFDIVYKKNVDGGENLHVFTDIYNVEQPPFFNTNDFVYLSFIAKAHGNNETLQISGGLSNTTIGTTKYFDYDYGRNYQVPFTAFSGSAPINPRVTGSEYRRYIFKSRQNYFRPASSQPGRGKDIYDISDYSETSTQVQILSSSEEVRSGSTTGGIGDGFAYGIRDSSGQQTQYIFPSVVDRNNLSNTFTFITGSVLPQGDLFPIFLLASGSSAIPSGHAMNIKFTDVHVSYKDPTNVHPFSTVYRPPSGSYAGSDEWNNWYSGIYASASLYDNDNIHSLVNNLPMSIRTEGEHEVMRKFVNMLGEQFDLLRNYIDNYLNFYKLGYTNPNSMPDNLLPILGDTVGWELLNVQNKDSSIEDYATSVAGDEVGVQAVINSTWKKILNNLMYVYKVKGTTEAINSLLNLYGFDSNGFKLHEYGGSTAEHNPTIITNTAEDFTEGITNIQGNVSYVQNIEPFPMINFRGTNSLGVDWWRNDSIPNGVEFVFNADKSLNNQTILRSSGSNNDLWDLRLIPSASSTDFSQLQFRLNTSNSGSGAIANSAVSMSSPFVDFQNGSIYNVFLQRGIVTGSSPYNENTQSYHMFIAKKDDDRILNVSATSMSCAISGANYNFVNQDVSKELNNLFVGETLSGSLAELRTWDVAVSMSKFKQHTLNYRSTVANQITGSVASLIYRYPFDENIVNWSINPNSASLKVHDANPQNIKDYSILIASQDNFNYTTTMTEQTFYRLSIKGNDVLPNDNQTNLNPVMTIEGQLNPDQGTVTDPTDASGQSERQYTNRFGRDVSYVNAVDTLVMNSMPDFRVDDFIGDPDEDNRDTYEDLMKLRKALIDDPEIRVDVEANIRAVENLLTDEIKDTLEVLTPAKTNFEMFYDVKNDTLFRSKIGRKMKLTPKLNPNKAIGVIDADKFDEPTLTSFANNNYKEGNIDADNSDEPTITSFANNKVVNGKIDADQWDEPTLNSFVNNKVVDGKIDADQWDEPTLNSSIHDINTSPVNIEMVDTSKSKLPNNFSATAEKMNEFFLGPKNHIAKNAGTASNQRFFKSINPGVFGDYNTYKFENRFTFKTIGDTELFINSQSHHDVFTSFTNRHFVDQEHPHRYVYNSFFGSAGDATVQGRMVGRTKFFKTDNDGNITYPSNHYINARTSKDQILRLTYLGTQHDGSNPTQDPIKNDPQPKIPAYIINVRGSDTLNRLKVDRPISKELQQMRLRLDSAGGGVGEATFKLFRRNKELLSETFDTDTRIKNTKFSLTGAISDYRLKITPQVGKVMIGARVIGRTIKQKAGSTKVQKLASINAARSKDGSMTVKFTKIRGPFTIQFRIKNR